MRKLTLVLLTLALALGTWGCKKDEDSGPTVSPEAQAEAALFALIADCANAKYDTAAIRMVYTLRTDSERRYKDNYDPSNPEELAAVQRQCEEFAAYRGEREVVDYKSETESDGTWHMIEVSFEGQDETTTFGFLEIDDLFMLGDID